MTTISKWLLHSLLLLNIIPTCSQPKLKLDTRDEALLDSLCEVHLKESKIPGLAIGIASKGQVMYAKGFGVKNIDTKSPVTARSVFHLASISKTFVGTAVGQLVAAGKINLDDPVTQYLPYFKLRDPRYQDITIRHLVTHTAGVPDVMSYGWRNPEHGDDALENHVRTLQKKGINFTPGEKFKYSNNGFEVLGDVIAKASGMSFEAIVGVLETHCWST